MDGEAHQETEGGRLMLKVNTSILTTGMILAKPIFDHQGKLLIDKGAKVKKSYIDKLLQYKIDTIYIHWNRECDPKLTEIITEETKTKALNLVKESINSIHIAQNLNVQKLEAVISDIIGEIMLDKGLLINLTDIRTIDDYTFGHSVNVCILALIMGLALNYEKIALKNLGLGAILHDIGKVYINNSYLNKPDLLTDEEYNEVKRHVIIGYDTVKNMEGINQEIAWIIRDHHERYDGKGYPNGLYGKQIHEFSRIVAICDVYDALTSNRVYRSGIPSHQAIEYLISMGNHQFDFDLVKVFLKNFCIYPIGTIVKLQSGEEGVVVRTCECYPTRPVIKVLRDLHGNPVRKSTQIDLTKNLNNGIIQIMKAI